MPEWKRYPYVPDWGDPRWFSFPEVDGFNPDLGMATYFVDGFLRGRSSGREYAFMVIVTDMRVLAKRVRASFYTFALYDRADRRYGTCTDYDFPRPPRIRRTHKLHLGRGQLGVRYAGANGSARWEQARAADSAQLRPFAWTIDLRGSDHRGNAMALVLDVDATRPPAPLGGRERGGEMMFLGLPSTFSYFQSGLRMQGELHWGDRREPVEGDVGWIDRQWAVHDFSRHQDRKSARYRNEWRVMQFANGWDMSCFHQYLRPERNAVVPWTGVSAQGPAPDFELRATTDVSLEIPEFIRSPGVVRGRELLTDGPRYFPYRYRLTAPDFGLDVSSTPWVDAPAHDLPIEYWTGPVQIAGRLFDAPVAGVGFDERSRPWIRGFEIAEAIRRTTEHLDDVAPETKGMLAYRAWEVEALALRDEQAAHAHATRFVVPLLAGLPTGAKERLTPMLHDLVAVLASRGRLP
jgi:predicted secreted hydrolase